MYIKTYGLNDIAPRRAIIPKQVHGSNVIELKTGEESLQNCDGIWTENDDLALGIRHADCVPLCFYSKEKFGVFHVGWRGLLNGMPEKILEIFPRTKSTGIFIGPFIHCFEVKKDGCYEALEEKFRKFLFANPLGKKTEEYPDGNQYFFCFAHAIFCTFYTSEYGNWVKNDYRDTSRDESLVSHRSKRGRTDKKNNTTVVVRSKGNLYE